MARKSSRSARKSDPSLFDLPDTFEPSPRVPPPPGGFADSVALHEAAQTRYLNYALSVITSPTTLAHLRCFESAVRFCCHIV